MIFQKYRKCKMCHAIGGMFVTRKKVLSTGKTIHYVENKCTLCANEESRNRHYRLSEDPEWKERKRLSLLYYKRTHKELMKKQAAEYWAKNKVEIQRRRDLKKEIKEKNKRKKNSHHRIPTNKNIYGKFDFRNLKTIMEESCGR